MGRLGHVQDLTDIFKNSLPARIWCSLWQKIRMLVHLQQKISRNTCQRGQKEILDPELMCPMCSKYLSYRMIKMMITLEKKNAGISLGCHNHHNFRGGSKYKSLTEDIVLSQHLNIPIIAMTTGVTAPINRCRQFELHP